MTSDSWLSVKARIARGGDWANERHSWSLETRHQPLDWLTCRLMGLGIA